MIPSVLPLLLALALQFQMPGQVDPDQIPGTGESQLLVSEDPRFVERLSVVYWPGAEERAKRVLETIEGFPGLPGVPDGFPRFATFYLAPDAEVWASLTGGAVPQWGGGVAIPSRRMAVLPLHESPAGGLAQRDRTTLHEWAHLGLHDYLRGLRIPRWFDEGYAQWASGGWDIEEGWRLRLALARGGAPPLDSLTLSWPVGESSARIAYLLSASAVEYLFSEGGNRGAEIFLERWRETRDFELAFRTTFGMTTAGFETSWATYVRERFGWYLILSQTALFWVLAALLLLPVMRMRRRQRIERTARLRAVEPPALPEYWAGEELTPGIGEIDPAGHSR